MNKQLIKDIIKIGNKAIEVSQIKYIIETKNDAYYYVYDKVYYNNDYIEFVDDYDNDITLSYDEINSIKVCDI